MISVVAVLTMGIPQQVICIISINCRSSICGISPGPGNSYAGWTHVYGLQRIDRPGEVLV